MELVKTQGRLMPIGGGEDKQHECRILKEFVRLAGDRKAKIVVMTTATDLPGEVAAEYREVFKRLGAADVRHIDVSERLDAMSPASVKVLRALVSGSGRREDHQATRRRRPLV